MMISSSRERGFEAKQENDMTKDADKSKIASSSRQWSGFRNPRIVRVSRTFGGKDRHSKVCTVRGLRDRRIRLSVPTAIQLYDLQDRLGLNQPSKVIDWLLDATKNDIDKLPPLQLPPGFGQFHHQMFLPHHELSSSINPVSQSAFASFFESNHSNSANFFKDGSGFHNSLGIRINGTVNDADHDHQSMNMAKVRPYWDMDCTNLFRTNAAKCKEVGLQINNSAVGKGKWIKSSVVQDQDHNNQDHGLISGGYSSSSSSSSTQKFFPLANHNYLNNAMPFNSYCHYNWDPSSSLSLSQFGSHGYQLQQPQVDQTNNSLNAAAVTLASLPSSSLSLTSGPSHSQLFFCPPPTLPPLFPTYPTPYLTALAAPESSDQSKQINHLQMLPGNNSLKMSSSSAMKVPFQLNVNYELDDMQNHNKGSPSRQE